MQVKFRGKRKGGNEWLIGDLSHVNGGTYIIPIEDAPLNSPDWFEVEPSSIGMFTGLTDKNGKEIYGAVCEKGGDIVGLSRVGMDNECVGVVDYDNDVASFVVNKINGGFEFLCKELQLNRALKIIGNATDNYELLNQK